MTKLQFVGYKFF